MLLADMSSAGDLKGGFIEDLVPQGLPSGCPYRGLSSFMRHIWGRSRTTQVDFFVLLSFTLFAFAVSTQQTQGHWEPNGRVPTPARSQLGL